MIIPEPESDLSLNLLIISAEVIQLIKERLKKKKYVILDDILKTFIEEDSRRTINLLLDAITFLYFIDVIYFKDYRIVMRGSSQSKMDKFLK